MAKSSKPAYKKLDVLLRKRGQKTLERFGEVAVEGITSPELLSVLADVKTYWKDTFRPSLTSLCCEAVGGNPKEAADVGLMITLASAGGGLHDDIIDKSVNKHFRMTILGLHGVDQALIVGDILILKGWAMIRNVIAEGQHPERHAEIAKAFENWTIEVCEAEFMETSCRRNLDTDLEAYQKILWGSMADTDACARLGAICGGGSASEVEALAGFGRRLGFMYRIADDIKDSLNIEGNLPDRLERESVPLPLLFAAKSSKKNYSKIKTVLDKPHATPSDVRELLGLCFETEAFAYALKLAKRNMREVTRTLRSLKPHDARGILALMAKRSFEDVDSLCL